MLDLMVILIVVLFGGLGLLSGLLLQVFRLASVILGVVAAMELSGPAMDSWPTLLSDQPGIREIVFPVLIFIIVYMVLSMIARLIVNLLRSASTTMSAADRLLGGLAGLAKGVVLCWFMIGVLLAAEGRSRGLVPVLDTDRSWAADFVREHPFSEISDIERLKQWSGMAVEEVKESAEDLMHGSEDDGSGNDGGSGAGQTRSDPESGTR